MAGVCEPIGPVSPIITSTSAENNCASNVCIAQTHEETAIGGGISKLESWMEVKQKLTPTQSVTRTAARGMILVT
jgi:hypothetical protein